MTIKQIREKLYPILPFSVFGDRRLSSCEMSQSDYVIIARILIDNKPLSILEIGAWSGSCTCLFGLDVKERGGHVVSVDNFGGSAGSNQTKNCEEARRLFFENIKRFGIEDSVQVIEKSTDDVELNEEFDLVFIDADHRYSQLIKDLKKFWPLVKEGGIMAGHDFDCTVFKEEFVEQDFVEGAHHGVIKALYEFFGNNVGIFVNDDKSSLVSSVWWVRK
jgi:predicted O-methyltransferase YrrM